MGRNGHRGDQGCATAVDTTRRHEEVEVSVEAANEDGRGGRDRMVIENGAYRNLGGANGPCQICRPVSVQASNGWETGGGFFWGTNA